MSTIGGADSAAAETVSGAANKTPSWRDHLPIHPAADLFPLMPEDELRELGEDIKKRSGLLAPVILYDGKLLDGRNRLDAMELVGINWDWSGDYITKHRGVIHCLDRRDDPYDFVITANLRRRHLTSEQKRELIAKVLKAKPRASNRKIAKQVKADDKTVASVRRDLESTAEIPQLEKTIGADGKQRKAKKKTKPAPKPGAEDTERDRKACVALDLKVREAERELAQWFLDHPVTASAEISEEQRRADNARLDKSDEDQEGLVDRALELVAAMDDEQRLRFYDKYTELYGAAS